MKLMATPFLLFLLKLLLLIFAASNTTTTTTAAASAATTSSSNGVTATDHHRRRRLVVLGDSYADTGNLPKIISPSWKQPYGITFPKKPSGRFSDGRVFTDFIASLMGIKSPVPYKYRRSAGSNLLPFGMNFAVGGSGVFDTKFLTINLTTQIGSLKEQVEKGAVDIQSSTALVVVSGNDYVFYRDNGGTMDGLKTFTPKLIKQLKLELESLVKLGVGMVAVTNLHPVGCLPAFTVNSTYTTCNSSVNLAAVYHNNLLEEAVKELNNSSSSISTVFVIDLFDAFMSVIGKGGEKILKPCCEGESSRFSCGSVDVNGMNRFKLCSKPESAFYWDSSHPTQAGWSSVFSYLKPNLTMSLQQPNCLA